eukprot:scaffold336024_cov46-Prasinocladus_malaysianus.AAC.2
MSSPAARLGPEGVPLGGRGRGRPPRRPRPAEMAGQAHARRKLQTWLRYDRKNRLLIWVELLWKLLSPFE